MARLDTSTPLASNLIPAVSVETPGQAIRYARNVFIDAANNLVWTTDFYVRCEVLVNEGVPLLVVIAANTVTTPTNYRSIIVILEWCPYHAAGGSFVIDPVPLPHLLHSDGWNGLSFARPMTVDTGFDAVTQTEDLWELLVPSSKGSLVAACSYPGWVQPVAEVHGPFDNIGGDSSWLSLQAYAARGIPHVATERLMLANGPNQWSGTEAQWDVLSSNERSTPYLTSDPALSEIADSLAHRDRLVSINHGGTVFNVDGSDITE